MRNLNTKYADLMQVAQDYKKAYKNATPFPNISFKNFFDEDMLNEVLEEFPDLAKKETLNSIHLMK